MPVKSLSRPPSRAAFSDLISLSSPAPAVWTQPAPASALAPPSLSPVSYQLHSVSSLQHCCSQITAGGLQQLQRAAASLCTHPALEPPCPLQPVPAASPLTGASPQPLQSTPVLPSQTLDCLAGGEAEDMSQEHCKPGAMPGGRVGRSHRLLWGQATEQPLSQASFMGGKAGHEPEKWVPGEGRLQLTAQSLAQPGQLILLRGAAEGELLQHTPTSSSVHGEPPGQLCLTSDMTLLHQRPLLTCQRCWECPTRCRGAQELQGEQMKPLLEAQPGSELHCLGLWAAASWLLQQGATGPSSRCPLCWQCPQEEQGRRAV